MSEKVEHWNVEDFNIKRSEINRIVSHKGVIDRGCKFYWYAPFENDFRGGFENHKSDYYSYDPKTGKEYKVKHIRILS